MYKKYTYQYKTGTDALVQALRMYDIRSVVIPSYTCMDLITACQIAGVDFIIVDCDDNLQISTDAICNVDDNFDAIIVPHMFGIQAPVFQIRCKFPSAIIIEDCSQAHGLPNIGVYSNVVVTSVNRGKWLVGSHMGLVYSDVKLDAYDVTIDEYIKSLHDNITRCVKVRKERAREITNAGIQLIANNQPNVFLRGMYKTEHQQRKPYIPLHDIYTEFQCPNVDKFKNNIDWISIHI